MAQTDPDKFLEMALHDVKWLFSLLDRLERPRLVLLAGCVTKRRYINHFLKERAPSHGWELLGAAQSVGRGRVGYHAFHKDGRMLAGFFCSVSPSANDTNMLTQRLNEHSDCLRRIIVGQHPGWTSNKRLQLTALRAAADAQR